MTILNIHSTTHQHLISSKTGEHFSQSAILLNSPNLFIHHEILLPNHRSSSPHTHTHREETILVLTGHPTLHLGSHSQSLKPGDFIHLPPHSPLHTIENTSTSPCTLLVICSNPPTDQTLHETPSSSTINHHA